MVFAYGASSERELGIEGEADIIKGSQLVKWYNGEVDIIDKYVPDIENIRDLAIIGNGNVALDIARIFLRTYEELMKSDMP